MYDKFKHGDESFKYLIGYIHDDVVKSLCSMLPQMSVYIQFTDKSGKNVLYN